MEKDDSKFDRIVKTVIVGLLLTWGGWVSGMVYAHGVAIAECKQWRQARPPFVTTDQAKLEILQKEKELRDMFNTRIDAKFAEFKAELDKVGQSQQETFKVVNSLDKRLAEHMATRP